MPRQLDPHLFSHTGPMEEPLDPRDSSTLGMKSLQEQVHQLKKSLSSMDSLVEVLHGKIQDSNHQMKNNTKALSESLSHLGEGLEKKTQCLETQLKFLSHRLNEMSSWEEKVGAMVDRFNTNIQQFENRLSALQKTLSKKDQTLVAYRGLTERLVDEVEKLKKHQSASTQRPIVSSLDSALDFK